MTVSATGPTFIQTPGNGVSVTFSFPFKVFQSSDVVVGFVVGGAYALQTTGYTVANVDVNGGGSVVFTTPPPFGTTVDIRSDVPQTQTTEFANLGTFLPEAHTEAFDHVVRAQQDLYRLTYTFGIHGPDTETSPWASLPAAAIRANQALVFDGNGNPVVGTLTSTPISFPLSISAGGTGALDPADAVMNLGFNPITIAEQNAGVSSVNEYYPVGNVLRYGADPTGATSSIPAFTQAFNSAMQATPHTAIYIPAGTYSIPSPGLSWSNQADIRVYGDGPNNSVLSYSGNNYTVLTISADTGGGTTGQNLFLSNFGISQTFGTTVSVNALKVADYQGFRLDNLQLYSSGDSLTMAGMAVGAVTACNCITAAVNAVGNTALRLTLDSTNHSNGPMQISGCNFNGQGNVTDGGAIWSNQTFGTVFQGCQIVAFGPSLNSVVALTNNDYVTFQECYSESSSNTTANTAVFFALGASVAVAELNVQGGLYFTGGNGAFFLNRFIDAVRVNALKVENTLTSGLHTSMIRVQNSNGATLVTAINVTSSGTANPPVFDSSMSGAPTTQFLQAFVWPALSTGWGTPTGTTTVSNFPGASATLPQTSGVLAQLIAQLKLRGILGP